MDPALLAPYIDKGISIGLLVIAVVWLVMRDVKRDNAMVGYKKAIEKQLKDSEATCREELAQERKARELLESDVRALHMNKIDAVNRALITVGEGFGDIKYTLGLIAKELNIPEDPRHRTTAQLKAIKGQ